MVIFKEISVEEYLAKRSISAKDGVVYRAAKSPKSFNVESRSMDFIMSDETIDSYGDEMKPKGCKLDRFLANPIALRNHRTDQVIGTWDGVNVSAKAVEGTVKLAAAGTSALVDETFSLMSQNILRACSVGFMPIRIEMKYDDQARPLYEFIIHEWDLYEGSVVAVPANPNALGKSMKDGVTACRDIIEEILDTYVKMPSGLIVTRDDFEKAHKEGSGNSVTIVVKEMDGKLFAQIRDMIKNGEADDIEDEQGREPDHDPILKKLETSVEDTIKSMETEIDEIPAEQLERRGLLKRAIDGIRSVFTAAPEPKKTEEKSEPEPETGPVLASEEEKTALLARLSKYEIDDLAA